MSRVNPAQPDAGSQAGTNPSTADGRVPRQRGTTAPRAPRAYRRVQLAGGFAVLAAAGVALTLPTSPSAHAVTGTVLLWQDGIAAGGPCAGTGEFGDVTAGADVQIADANGKPLAAGVLQPGRSDGAATCTFTFLVADVARADAYRIAVGTHAGGAFTHPEMRAQSWSVRLTLGT